MNIKNAIFALAATTIAATAELKVATIDVATLFDGYYKTAETQKVINLERAKLQKENEESLKKVQELKKKHDTIRKSLEDPSINEKKKVELLKEFEEVRQAGTQLERQRVETGQRKSASLNEKAAEDASGIFAEIQEEINIIAEADGYDLVLNKKVIGARGIPVFIYSKDTLDITEKVNAKLLEKAPKSE